MIVRNESRGTLGIMASALKQIAGDEENKGETSGLRREEQKASMGNLLATPAKGLGQFL